MVSTERNGSIRSITVTNSMKFSRNEMKVELSSSDIKPVEIGEKVSLSLGYGKVSERVFTGEVSHHSAKINKLEIVARDSLTRLSSIRVNKTFENSNSGSLIRDLASQGQVDVLRASEGEHFPFYTVDDNQNAFSHILQIAHLCGFDLYMTSEDKLIFDKYIRKKPHICEYGANIISLSSTDEDLHYKGSLVYGEGFDNTKWYWLSKDEVSGSAGSREGGRIIILRNGAIRGKQRCLEVAKSLLDKRKWHTGVAIEMPGRPEIKLGDTIHIANAPDIPASRDYQVRTIVHTLNKTEGFITNIKCRGIEQT